MWISEYHFDGVRVDSTMTLRRREPCNHGHGREDYSRDTVEAWRLLQCVCDEVRRLSPRKVLIAEDFGGTDKINVVAGFDCECFVLDDVSSCTSLELYDLRLVA